MTILFCLQGDHLSFILSLSQLLFFQSDELLKSVIVCLSKNERLENSQKQSDIKRYHSPPHIQYCKIKSYPSSCCFNCLSSLSCLIIISLISAWCLTRALHSSFTPSLSFGYLLRISVVLKAPSFNEVFWSQVSYTGD